YDRGLHRLRPRPRALVIQERHRRDLIRAMARLAILLQDRQYVSIESYSSWRGGWHVRSPRERCQCKKACDPSNSYVSPHAPPCKSATIPYRSLTSNQM